MRRSVLTLLAALAIAALTAGTAMAGGWATTELDEPLPELTAGESHEIGLTILQHGMTPASVEGPGLRFTSKSTGVVAFFPAEPQGPVGHYMASVALPIHGTWALEVEQGSLLDARSGAPLGLHFEAFPVGAVSVAAVAAPEATVQDESPRIWPVVAALAVAGVVAAAGIALTVAGRVKYATTTEEAV